MSTSALPTVLPRKVTLDFNQVRAGWNTKDPEFGHFLNAISTVLPYLEPFLIRTLEAAGELLDPEETALRREVEAFCYQERRHHANHAKFNRRVAATGFAEPLADAKRRADAYYEQLERRSPRFRLAWSEGFETIAPFVGIYFFDNAAAFGLDDWDEPTVFLWLWHMSEEFEHRTVCNYTYKALYDDYWCRVRGLWSASSHLFAYSIRLAVDMAGPGWASMSRRRRWRSQLHLAALVARLGAFAFPRVVGQAMRPSYDPAELSPPAGMQDLLDQATQRYGLAASSA